MTKRDSLADRISELEEWRRRAEPAFARFEANVTELENEQKIAAGIAEELRRRGIAPSAEMVANRTVSKLEQHGSFPTAKLSLTWYQRAGAFVAGALVLADAVRGLVS